MPRALVLGAALIVVVLVALGAFASATPRMAGTILSEVPLDRADLFSRIAWTEAGIVVDYPLGDGVERRLGLVDRSSGVVTELPLPPDEQCVYAAAQQHVLIAGGRIGFVFRCWTDTEGTTRTSLYQLDIITGTFSRYLVLEELGLWPFVAWSPDGTRGVMVIGNGICDGLFAVSRDGVGVLPQIIRDGSKSFTLASTTDLSGECTETGRAHWPAWASTNDVAFVASPQAVGLSNRDRTTVPENLYVMSDLDGDPQAVVKDVQYPGFLAWSSDGRSLAFSADGSVTGTYLVNAADHTMFKLSDRRFDSMAWAPGSARLVAIERDDNGGNTRLVTIDAPK